MPPVGWRHRPETIAKLQARQDQLTAARPEAFWQRVNKTDDCWWWMGSGKPYGQFSLRHKPVSAHRYAFELTYGPIPAGSFVCHKCDQPRCVRPDHLFLGSPTDNVHDMMRKGRAALTGRPRRASSEAIAEMNRLRDKGMTVADIARRYSLPRQTVSRYTARRAA